MPFTFFAHQAPILPLKTRWPEFFDGTALCLASVLPDIGYAVPGVSAQSHRMLGMVTWGLVGTLVGVWLMRRFVAPVALAYLPDFGPFRVWSYRALRHRRPALWQTVVGWIIGYGSHLLLDAFTHEGRWGSRRLGWDGYVGSFAGVPFSIARIFQFLGHTLGSVVGLIVLLRIGQHRLMERWYGDSVVHEARQFTVTNRQRLGFWVVIAAAALPTLAQILTKHEYAIFDAFLWTGVALVLASATRFTRPANR
jgi:hypothetical protein